MDEVPPWSVVPDLDPDDPDAHGIGEAYILIDWLRFWQTLTPEQKAAYLDRWDASPGWREAILTRYEFYPVETAAHRPWWRRWW